MPYASHSLNIIGEIVTAEAQSVLKTKKPIWKRWWMIVIYVLVGLAVIANLSGGSDEGVTAEDPAPSSEIRTTVVLGP